MKFARQASVREHIFVTLLLYGFDFLEVVEAYVQFVPLGHEVLLAVAAIEFNVSLLVRYLLLCTKNSSKVMS